MLNKLLFPETRAVIEAVGEQNIRFVGGCVRDLIANLPVTDIDFATKLTPEQVILACNEHNIKTVPTGIAHGTVTAVVRGWQFEITTLRKDLSGDGRHAQIEYVDDWEEDAARRDFTINAFYLSAEGKLTDFFGGMDHLKSGKVVFIGEAEDRIREDFLRILRYFRFLGKFGGENEVDPHLARLFSRYSAHINHLSGERIQTEMFKILELENASKTLHEMQDCGVLHFIFPGDVSFEVLDNLQQIEHKPDALRRLAAIENYDEEQLVGHWKLSNEHKKILRLLKTDISLAEPKVVMRHLGKERFKDVVYVESARGHCEQSLEELLEFANTWKVPNFPVMGNDVMALGIKEGRQIGQILLKLEQYWEQHGYLLTREELLKRLKHIVEEETQE